jgi:hypothetical protein
MHIEINRYPIMSGEPHLGSITEYELIAEPYEVEYWILDKVVEDVAISNEYEFAEIIIDASEYVDVGEIQNYLDELGDDDIDEQKLYDVANIKTTGER